MSGKIRVAQVITGLVLGGGGQVMWTIARNFDRRRFDLDVYCVIGGGELLPEFEKLGVPVRIIPAHVQQSIVKYRPREVLALARELKHGHYHLVHTHLYQADVIGGLAARAAGIHRRIKSLHNMGGWKRRHHIVAENVLAGRADRVVCCSQWLAESAIRQEGLDPSRVVTIYHGVDVARFQVAIRRDEYVRSLGLDPAKRIVGTIGRPIEEKGHQYLLDAIPAIRARHPDTQFLIVGEGRLRRALQQRIDEAGLQAVVKLPGARPDVPELLSAMDLFVFPSVSEGLGIAILEAMAARVPVVASDIRPISEIAVPEETALLVEARNPSALAQAVNRLLADAALAGRLRDRAFHHVSTRYSEREMVRSLEDVYVDLCKEDVRPVVADVTVA